jgi:hypothetical protein
VKLEDRNKSGQTTFECIHASTDCCDQGLDYLGTCRIAVAETEVQVESHKMTRPLACSFENFLTS